MQIEKIMLQQKKIFFKCCFSGDFLKIATNY